MIFRGTNNEYMHLQTINSENCFLLKKHLENSLSLLWITQDGTILEIDNYQYTFNKNQIVSLTDFNSIKVISVTQLIHLKFNKPFYCIAHNDSEVGCKGLLFFGAQRVPIITIPEEDIDKFEVLIRMLSIEMESKDDLQIEMLQMMLKRLLIMCTRLHKTQNNLQNTDSQTLDLVREFNLLVETHFKTNHAVSDYAKMLHKSPKTLSNYFSKTYNKTPLQFIQERLLLEAKRFLHYTNKPIKEIAYDLGFDDVQGFSRFFKNKEGVSPTEFKLKLA
jgi:AraC family transcriptional activator of pobA